MPALETRMVPNVQPPSPDRPRLHPGRPRGAHPRPAPSRPAPAATAGGRPAGEKGPDRASELRRGRVVRGVGRPWQVDEPTVGEEPGDPLGPGPGGACGRPG